MAVLVLMYHATPKGAAETRYDVPLATFQAQIDTLAQSGIPFIPFDDAQRPEYLDGGLHVAVTFDDGHATNEAALRFLHDRGVVGTSFVVRQWSERGVASDGRAGYMPSGAIVDLAQVCAFGGHSAEHRNLTTLTPTQLGDDLARSRDYLEAILGRAVRTMALPGGKGNAAVLKAARGCGFTLIGDSVHDVNRRSSASVHRLAVLSSHHAGTPLAWARAPARSWASLRVKRRVIGGVRGVLGDGFTNRLRSLAGRG